MRRSVVEFSQSTETPAAFVMSGSIVPLLCWTFRCEPTSAVAFLHSRICGIDFSSEALRTSLVVCFMERPFILAAATFRGAK